MKPFFTVTVEVEGKEEKHLFIAVHPAIASAMSLKSGELFRQELADNGGILLTKVAVENNDAGAALTSETLTPARRIKGGAEI